MRAVVIEQAGGPEVLKLQDRPVPKPESGWVLVKVKAFGINRSELFTRQGHSPAVRFPRILGIEAVGEVAEAPGGEFRVGQKVATAMGGMGRQFDGSYAEYTCVPAAQVQGLTTTLEWPTLAALPEMLQTAWGSLHTALQLEPGQSLLIRGGTTSVGLAAAVLAKKHGAVVSATTVVRNARRRFAKTEPTESSWMTAKSPTGSATRRPAAWIASWNWWARQLCSIRLEGLGVTGSYA